MVNACGNEEPLAIGVNLTFDAIPRRRDWGLLGHRDEACVGNHAVLGSGSSFVHHPVPFHELERVHGCEAVCLEFPEHQLDLAHIGTEAQEKSSLPEESGYRTNGMPGFRQVQVYLVGLGAHGEVLDVRHDDVVVFGRATKELGDVVPGRGGEFRALFHGDEAALSSNGPQERHGESSRADARFQDEILRSDVAVEDHGSQVLGIDDLGLSIHGENVVLQGGPENEELGTFMSFQVFPFFSSKDVSQVDDAQVAGELLILQSDEPLLAFLRGEHDPLTRAKPVQGMSNRIAGFRIGGRCGLRQPGGFHG